MGGRGCHRNGKLPVSRRDGKRPIARIIVMPQPAPNNLCCWRTRYVSDPFWYEDCALRTFVRGTNQNLAVFFSTGRPSDICHCAVPPRRLSWIFPVQAFVCQFRPANYSKSIAL